MPCKGRKEAIQSLRGLVVLSSGVKAHDGVLVDAT